MHDRWTEAYRPTSCGVAGAAVMAAGPEGAQRAPGCSSNSTVCALHVQCVSLSSLITRCEHTRRHRAAARARAPRKGTSRTSAAWCWISPTRKPRRRSLPTPCERPGLASETLAAQTKRCSDRLSRAKNRARRSAVARSKTTQGHCQGMVWRCRYRSQARVRFLRR